MIREKFELDRGERQRKRFNTECTEARNTESSEKKRLNTEVAEDSKETERAQRLKPKREAGFMSEPKLRPTTLLRSTVDTVP